MKKIFTLLAISAFAANFSSQVITQSTGTTVVTGGSVACGNTSYTADNSYTRAFTLSDYAIAYDFKITNVSFGVESVNKALNVAVNVYGHVGTYPAGTLTLLKSAPVAITPANNLGLVNTGTALTQTIPAGSKFVLEVVHDGTTGLELFYLGTNAAAETKPSYIKSATCGIAAPQTTSAIGFPNAKWVMTVTGVNNLGVTEIINSKDLQVYPNPVKDVLNFKLASNLKVESIELYNVGGQKVNTVNAKATEGVNVANFPKGTYILKVKADNGVVYVQKILKN